MTTFSPPINLQDFPAVPVFPVYVVGQPVIPQGPSFTPPLPLPLVGGGQTSYPVGQ